MGEERLYYISIHDGGRYYVKTGTLVCRANRVNALLIVCIHRDIFLDYDKIIDIYASKYPRRMLLINPLSEN